MRSRLFVAGLATAAGLVAAPVSAAGLRVENALVFTRPDGSAVSFAHYVRVWCGRWDRDVPVRALHIRVGRSATGTMWWFRAVPREVRRRPEVRLPHDFVWNRPTGAHLFVADGDGSELSSSVATSAGRIVVRRARCGRRLAVRLRIDATVGSEFIDGPPLTVGGSFRASVAR